MKNESLAQAFVFSFLAFVIVGIASVPFGTAQNSIPPSPQWEHEYSGPAQIGDPVKCLIQTSDGGYAFVGTGSPYSGTQVPPSTVFTKTDSSGTLQLQIKFGYTDALGLVQTSDDGYVLAGSDNATSGTVLFKLDSKGSVQWVRTYPYSRFYNSYVGTNLMVVTKDGGFALTGTQSSKVWLVKTDSAGIVQWNYTYDENFDRGVDCFIQIQDGSYLMVGSLIQNPYSSGSPSTLKVLKISPTGALVWGKAYNENTSSWDRHSVIQVSDGGYVFTDDTNSSKSHMIFKTNQDGTIEWSQTIASNNDTTSSLHSAAETSDDGIAFSGMLQSPLGGIAKIWIVKTDNSGTIAWSQTYGTALPNGRIGAFYYFGGSRIIESIDGSLVVAGGASKDGSAYQAEYYLLKTQPFLPKPTPTATPLSTPTETPTITPSLAPTPSLSPTPTSTLLPTQTPTTSVLSPSPSVPEFPTWPVLPLAAAVAFVGVLVNILRRKKT